MTSSVAVAFDASTGPVPSPSSSLAPRLERKTRAVDDDVDDDDMMMMMSVGNISRAHKRKTTASRRVPNQMHSPKTNRIVANLVQ